MGGCATKPRELKGAAPAPPPLEQPPPEEKAEEEKTEKEAATAGKEQPQPDDNRRRSLSRLFKEDEDTQVSSETDKIVVKETITSSSIREKDAVEQPNTDEQPNTEEHPAEESIPRNVEPETSYTAQEQETSVASDSVASEDIIKDIKPVDPNAKEDTASIVKEVIEAST